MVAASWLLAFVQVSKCFLSVCMFACMQTCGKHASKVSESMNKQASQQAITQAGKPASTPARPPALPPALPSARRHANTHARMYNVKSVSWYVCKHLDAIKCSHLFTSRWLMFRRLFRAVLDNRKARFTRLTFMFRPCLMVGCDVCLSVCLSV